MRENLKTRTLRIINLRHAADRETTLEQVVSEYLSLPASCLTEITILRRATDARQERLDFVYTLSVTIEASAEEIKTLLARTDISEYQKPAPAVFTKARCTKRPIIIGCGPAGLFAACALVERGVKPIVIDRGERITNRAETVENFWRRGEIHPESNVLYGEGGAGTFSDGKLNTRTKSPLKTQVFKTLIAMGADPAIAYESKPHIGTDRLREIIPALVDDLQARGADFLFETRVSDIEIDQGRVTGLTAGGRHFPAETVFLAAGHSSRDTYRLLHERGVRIEPKDFAVGLRIEHPQEFIDTVMLGQFAQHPALAPAEYFLSHKDSRTGRGVYSFCMCPGGYVIGCATGDGRLCTNGMSTSGRDSGMANAAIVVSVRESDFAGQGPLGGILFQEQLEKAAFDAGGGGFFAPVQAAADFMNTKPADVLTHDMHCSYKPGIHPTALNLLLPDFICSPLQRGLDAFNKKIPGFIGRGILVGVETCTSSPVRIVRDKQTYHALGIRGLIPIGEGSGYAGGIISSAVDGLQGALHFDA